MAETFVEVTEGSGKKLHALSRTVSGSTVYDEAVAAAFPHAASYVARGYGLSTATAGSHLIQLMAGSTNNVYITKIRMFQIAMATALSLGQFSLVRLTTAGTGGTAITPSPLDTTDSASNTTAMTLPTANGTESTTVTTSSGMLIAAVTAAISRPEVLIYDFESLYTKPLRIPSGTLNGLCVRNVAAVAGATVAIEISFFEATY